MVKSYRSWSTGGRSLLICGLLGQAVLIGLAQETIQNADPNGEGWKPAGKSGDVALYSRVRPGSPLKEFKAVGEIDAATPRVEAVLNDSEEYPKFMPYTAECRLIRTEADATVIYQRLKPGLVADRDYTLRVWKRSWPVSDGMAYIQRWSPANDLGPPPVPHTVRVNRCEGSWFLEPMPNNKMKTRATYTIYTDTGGEIPVFVANFASRVGIGKIFTAVRKQVKDPKYARRE